MMGMKKAGAIAAACVVLAGCDGSLQRNLGASAGTILGTAAATSITQAFKGMGPSKPAPSESGLRRTYASGALATPARAAELDRLAVQAAAYRLVVQVRSIELGDASRPVSEVQADMERDRRGLAVAKDALMREIEIQATQYSGEDLSGYKRLGEQLSADPSTRVSEIARGKPLRAAAEQQARRIYAGQVSHLAS